MLQHRLDLKHRICLATCKASDIAEAMSSIDQRIQQAIENAIEGASAEVSGDGRHFNLRVVSAAFESKNTLGRHRMVLSAIAELMGGDNAPVHAIDSIKALTPDQV